MLFGCDSESQGTLYKDSDGAEERQAALVVAQDGRNDADVAIFMRCSQSVRDADLCTRLEDEYYKHDYADMLNSTFALIPSGHSPATRRLAETLAAGCVPVFIHNDFVKPFVERISWSTFSFSFAPANAWDILHTLRAVGPEELIRMQVRFMCPIVLC